jgi:hypothetical protein
MHQFISNAKTILYCYTVKTIKKLKIKYNVSFDVLVYFLVFNGFNSVTVYCCRVRFSGVYRHWIYAAT